jgi:hypothetical protein
LPGIDLKTKQLVMTCLASMLFDKFTRFKMEGKEKYLIFMIEEAQNFCPDKSFPISTSLAHRKLSDIATKEESSVYHYALFHNVHLL